MLPARKRSAIFRLRRLLVPFSSIFLRRSCSTIESLLVVAFKGFITVESEILVKRGWSLDDIVGWVWEGNWFRFIVGNWEENLIADLELCLLVSKRLGGWNGSDIVWLLSREEGLRYFILLKERSGCYLFCKRINLKLVAIIIYVFPRKKRNNIIAISNIRCL